MGTPKDNTHTHISSVSALPAISSASFKDEQLVITYSYSPIIQPAPRRQRLFLEFLGEAWGNETAFERSCGDIKYLDLSSHLQAVQGLYPWIPEHGKILIREEYREAEKVIREADGPYKSGILISGQPGIGKTLLLIYFTIKCLGRREPVAFQAHNYYTLLKEGNVVQSSVPIDMLECERVWAVFDCNTTTGLPPNHFTSAFNTRLVVAACPDTTDLRKWLKESRLRQYILDVWSVAEMTKLATVLTLDECEMLRLVSLFGTIPSTVISLLDMQGIESAVMRRLRSIAQSTMKSLSSIHTALVLNNHFLDTGSSSLIHIRPYGTTGAGRSNCVPFVPTLFILGLLLNQAVKADASEQEAFFYFLSENSSAKGVAGTLFEQFGYDKFCRGLKTNCTWISPQSSPSEDCDAAMVLACFGH